MTEAIETMNVAPAPQAFGEDWIAAYFADVDSLDTARLLRWYAEDASFRFAGHPPVHGKTAIAGALGAFFATIASMHHEKTGAWIDREAASAAWEAEVTFTRKDGTRATLPAMSALRLRDGLIHDFRFVMDPAPLYAAPASEEAGHA